MYDDLFEGFRKNYYQAPDGQIVKILAVKLSYNERSNPIYLEAIIVKKLGSIRSPSDIVQGEFVIPLKQSNLNKYKKISDSEILELRIGKIN